ncbi:DUF6174 domain-containing protein [Streptomyces sp. WMMB 322]|uniref:DUF6174 domain-containing protein n=1 Tax=Streptomyces sp. WMMB 322 TaxID=1286821 RepID=UPI0008239DF0|nr:DUF6174 domain-containing protein [Streptomyces sp. WMMB 322]SCK42545.1 hypothetical protein H180DRAFT_03706 [Streptomyces sp. WMMB 322]
MSHAWGNARTSLGAAAGVTLAGALLNGCGTGSEYSGGTDWKAPRRYSYTLETSTMAVTGSFRVRVRDGKVVRARLLDGSRMPAGRLEERVHSVEELLKRVEDAREVDAHRADVAYDGDHRPARIELDPYEEASDDQASYRMRDYRIG